MEYIARHHQMDLALAWALRLEGKTDQENSKNLGGAFAHGTSGILTNAMNDSEMTGPAASRPSSLPTPCSISQNPAILSLTPWPGSLGYRKNNLLAHAEAVKGSIRPVFARYCYKRTRVEDVSSESDLKLLIMQIFAKLIICFPGDLRMKKSEIPYVVI